VLIALHSAFRNPNSAIEYASFFMEDASNRRYRVTVAWHRDLNFF
jgi:hypothetical protein